MGVEAFALYGLVGLQGAEKTQQGLQGVSREADKTKKGLGGVSGGMKGLTTTLGIAAAAVATFGVAWTKAMELGKAGAQVTQTGQSFEGLIQRMGGTGETLAELRRESKGTVDDLKLMSSTTALLSGTSGQLSKALLNATPELMEMAKAANKLNPTLGDTTYMYESLALGIKRGSPMILDNLGITVSIEQANRKYADSLGVSVDALTKEQQQMALLNAVLEKGGILVSQAGGNTDSATDSFARFDAASKNLADELKAGLAPALAEVAEGATWLITYSKRVDEALQTHATEVMKNTKTYDDYVTEMLRASVAAGKIDEASISNVKNLGANSDSVQNLMKSLGYMSEAQYTGSKAIANSTQYVDRWDKAIEDATTGALQGFDEAAKAIEEYKKTMDEAQQVARDFYVTQSGLSESLKDAQNADLARVAVDQLNESLQAGTITQSQYDAAVKDAQLTYGLATAKSIALAENIAAVTAAAATGIIPQAQLAEALAALNEDAADGAVSLEALLIKLGANKGEAKAFADEVAAAADANKRLADQPGKISDSAKLAEDALARMEEKFDGVGGKADDSAGQVENFAKQVEALRDRINELKDKKVTITLDTIGNAPPVDVGGDANTAKYGGASGLDYTVPPGYPHDSYPVRAQSGERVIVMPAGQSGPVGGNRFYGNVTFVVQGGSIDDMMSQVRR